MKILRANLDRSYKDPRKGADGDSSAFFNRDGAEVSETKDGNWIVVSIVHKATGPEKRELTVHKIPRERVLGLELGE